MNVEVITAAPFYPLGLEDLYKKLKLDTEGSPPTHPLDDMLLRYLKSATKYAEDFTHRAFVQQRLRLTVGQFPKPGKGIDLLRPPLIRVESVSYYDLDNSLTALAEADWYVADGRMPQLRLLTNASAPSTYDRPDAVRIDYIAGYPPAGSPSSTQADYADNVPPDIVTGIWLGVQLLYENLTPEEAAMTERARDHFLSAERVIVNP